MSSVYEAVLAESGDPELAGRVARRIHAERPLSDNQTRAEAGCDRHNAANHQAVPVVAGATQAEPRAAVPAAAADRPVK